MKKIMRSPWFGISLAIVGLVAGYSAVVLANGDMVAWECPLAEECVGEHCAKHDVCSSGECSKDCPGNCEPEES